MAGQNNDLTTILAQKAIQTTQKPVFQVFMRFALQKPAASHV